MDLVVILDETSTCPPSSPANKTSVNENKLEHETTKWKELVRSTLK